MASCQACAPPPPPPTPTGPTPDTPPPQDVVVTFKLKPGQSMSPNQITQMINNGLPPNYKDSYKLSGPNSTGYYQVTVLPPNPNPVPPVSTAAAGLAAYLNTTSAVDPTSISESLAPGPPADPGNNGPNVGLIVGVAVAAFVAAVVILGAVLYFLFGQSHAGFELV